MNSAKFRSTNLKLACDIIWKENKLKDAQKKVMIPAFLMDNHSADEKLRSSGTEVFHNLVEGDSCSEELAVDVVMRSGAAPTFFPSYQQYTDGGIFSHDPSSQALVF
jgi:patatin-like phospholipase/acyl hydrolase